MADCTSSEQGHFHDATLTMAANGTYSFRYQLTGMAPGIQGIFTQFYSETMGGYVDIECYVAIGADGTGEGGIDNIPTDVSMDSSVLFGGGVLAYFEQGRNGDAARVCGATDGGGGDDYDDDFSDDYGDNYSDDYSDDFSDDFTDDFSDDSGSDFSDDFGEEIFYD